VGPCFAYCEEGGVYLMSQFIKTKILVVDDDEHICELIRLYFEKEGFAVNIANDGNKAIESVNEVAFILGI
jgi:DNA-binding response OmpR family regulator